MTLPAKTDLQTPYRLRASAAGLAVAAPSSLLRVARSVAIDRRTSPLKRPHDPQQLAFDFHRRGR